MCYEHRIRMLEEQVEELQEQNHALSAQRLMADAIRPCEGDTSHILSETRAKDNMEHVVRAIEGDTSQGSCYSSGHRVLDICGEDVAIRAVEDRCANSTYIDGGEQSEELASVRARLEDKLRAIEDLQEVIDRQSLEIQHLQDQLVRLGSQDSQETL